MIIPIVALGASVLTLISGFGLGTLLLPVFALFFPLEVAVLLTGVVHLLNNMFKLGLLARAIDRSVLLRFGLPAIVGAFFGARFMLVLGRGEPLFQGVQHPVHALDLIIAALMSLFGLLELSKRFNTLSLAPQWMFPGGLLSGFLGGLSGHQGALRSLFLLRAGLSKEAFIATGVAIACLVDVTRIPMYLSGDAQVMLLSQWPLLATTVAMAFAGAWWGRTLIPKITVRAVQVVVGVLMVVVALTLATGLI